MKDLCDVKNITHKIFYTIQLSIHFTLPNYLPIVHYPTIYPLYTTQLSTHCTLPNYLPIVHYPTIYALYTTQLSTHCTLPNYLPIVHYPIYPPIVHYPIYPPIVHYPIYPPIVHYPIYPPIVHYPIYPPIVHYPTIYQLYTTRLSTHCTLPNLSTNLNFNSHIQRISSNANKSLGYIKRSIRPTHPGIREAAYKTLVRPQFEYGSTVSSPYTQSNIHKVEMVQRIAIRWTLSNHSPYESVTDMQLSLGWRSLEQRTDPRLCRCMLYKIVHGFIAVPLPPYFQQPTRMTRHSHPLTYIISILSSH